MQVSIVQVWVLYLEKSIQNIFLFLGLWQSEILTVLHICLHKLIEQIILRWNKNRFRTWSETTSGVPKSRFFILDKRHSDGRAERGE